MIWIMLAYIVFAPITYSGTFAYFQRAFPSIAHENYREDLAMAVFCALIPVIWVAVPFMTGLYKHGFKFK